MIFEPISQTAPIHADEHGARAKCLQRLIRLDMPVPDTVALPFEAVRKLASGAEFDLNEMLDHFGELPLVSVRPSAQTSDWGGPGTVLNIGMNPQSVEKLAKKTGKAAAEALYLRFIQSYAIDVARLDAEEFPPSQTIKEALAAYEIEVEEPFPTDVSVQLSEVLRSMARAWEGTSARLLRQAKGAPADAGLGLLVQRMAFGLGQGESGSGVIQFVNAETGEPQITGRYLSQSQGREALAEADRAIYLTKDERGSSLEEREPETFAALIEQGARCRFGLREEMQIEFTLEDGELSMIDALRVPRGAFANLRIAVDLANDDVIPTDHALLRVEPQALTELLHPRVDPDAPREILATGIAASPGAATGKIVFSATAAQTAAAQGEACILVRAETSTEDIRGMHEALGVLTERGGITSHAAVIARGLGVPCVVGASSINVSMKDKTVELETGEILGAGDVITLDGAAGQALRGAVATLPAALNDYFTTFMGWAEAAADIGVRANVDSEGEAEVARRFGADGIGLCRTEHMFFEDDRLTVMREMIFADETSDRTQALARLLPMQRNDFKELFRVMDGKPVCIRLFDPPLHEFLPSSKNGVRKLAEAMDLPVSKVNARVESLTEFNPMLGLRGVRLGVTVPEIYEMQARAIFEATVECKAEGIHAAPEIMIPLVSVMREVEVIQARIEAMAAAVHVESGVEFDYKLGVMVETPRAALRSGDIAKHAGFISFGTNDLTQMTYGLSRDDAGRFMGAYVAQNVYPEDPFHTLDVEGVGELLSLGCERARSESEGITLSICGEHAGNPDSIAYCRSLGMNYVSCSPYRVPGSRLAAAQLAVRDKGIRKEKRSISNSFRKAVELIKR